MSFQGLLLSLLLLLLGKRDNFCQVEYIHETLILTMYINLFLVLFERYLTVTFPFIELLSGQFLYSAIVFRSVLNSEMTESLVIYIKLN